MNRKPAGTSNDAQLYAAGDRPVIVQVGPEVRVKNSAGAAPDPNAAISGPVASGPAARAATA
jgi:hypothetical protein